MALEADERNRAPEGGSGTGLLKGLMVTLRTMMKPAVTQQYPHVKPDLPPRTRGVIALKEANCTVCWKCSRECPDWCIYIDTHKETHEPASGGRARSVKVLDRFAIDYALCMYCGICVEVCPFDALFWSPEFEYAEFDLREMTHEKERLEDWTYTVLPPPELEVGAEPPEEHPAEAAPAPQPAAAAPAPAADAPAAAAAATEAPEAEAAGPATAPADAGTPPGEQAPESPGEATAEAAAAAQPSAPSAPTEPVEVEMDQEVFEQKLAELLEQGTDRRVAEGQARRAAMIAARKKAQGS